LLNHLIAVAIYDGRRLNCKAKATGGTVNSSESAQKLSKQKLPVRCSPNGTAANEQMNEIVVASSGAQLCESFICNEFRHTRLHTRIQIHTRCVYASATRWRDLETYKHEHFLSVAWSAR
jgi:hypothetical protein